MARDLLQQKVYQCNNFQMNSAQYNNLYSRVISALDRHRINEAIASVRNALTEIDDSKIFSQELERIAETYRYMTSYALDGYSDPTRAEQTASIGRRLLKLMNLGRRELQVRENSGLYYSTLRFIRRQPEQTIKEVVEECIQNVGTYNLMSFNDTATREMLRDIRIKLESLQRRLFEYIWVSAPLTEDDKEAIVRILRDEVAGDTIKSLVVGALFLGLLEYFDPMRVLLLIEAYELCSPAVSLRALTLLTVALTMTDRTALSNADELRPRFAALADDMKWRKDVTEVFRQLLKSRDTERITRKMNDEIIPSMRNISGNISSIIKDREGLDAESIEDMEQWQKLVDDAGITDKMREMSELQESGGDIMMTTFSHLKDFPFFREISNWFIPFDTEHSAITSMAISESIADMIADLPMLCDNDKYSMALSVARVPQEQREFLARQMAEQAGQMAELKASALNRTHDDRLASITGVVRDMYRFFHLYNRAAEFVNPFNTSLNLMEVPMIKDTIDRDELLKLAADFYFTHGYHSAALPMLIDMEADIPTGEEADFYYRMGVCFRHDGNNEKALTYLERSELFDDKRKATLVELGQCFRLSGNHRKAYEYFRRASLLKPEGDNSGLQLQMAAELIELERYEEALQLLYRLEFLYGLTPAFTRRLAVCEMMIGRYDKCREHLEKLDRTTADDMVCYAVIEVAQKNYRTALERLKSAVNLMSGDVENIFAKFDNLSPVILKAGVEQSIIDLIKDNVQ